MAANPGVTRDRWGKGSGRDSFASAGACSVLRRGRQAPGARRKGPQDGPSVPGTAESGIGRLPDRREEFELDVVGVAEHQDRGVRLVGDW
jgi:hypothetical protein